MTQHNARTDDAVTARPARAERFYVLGWAHGDARGRYVCRFQCSTHGAFEERISLPAAPDGAAERALLPLLTIAVGVSYYKAGAAKTIGLPSLGPAARAMAEALYTDGLAEFFVRAQLPFPDAVAFEGSVEEAPSPPPMAPAGPALVAFGGGKDSYVAYELLREAGETVQLASVVLSDAVASVLQATAPEAHPPVNLRRQLDPTLTAASAKGFNGHVPITAINMLTMSLYASTAGFTQVVFANERSADEPTMALEDGTQANHQYSKSSAFERLLQAAMREAGAREGVDLPVAYSLLRPYAELWIASRFTAIRDAHPRFTSCNRNFRLAGDASQRWCGACAKCAFTSLMTAPFIDAATARTMFGDILLDRRALLPFWEEILGLSRHKPWDCVGTIDESRAALFRLRSHPDFKDSLLVKTLLPRLLDTAKPEVLERAWTEALTPFPLTQIPAAYHEAAGRMPMGGDT